MSFNIDVAIVVGFLIATLVVGLGHGSKVKTIKDYALGGRNFSTGALVATIVATWISGSMFLVDLTNNYSEGLSYLITCLGFPFAFFISAYIFIPRMSDFLGKTSVAEAMGDIYNNNIRVIIAICGVIGSAGSIAVQFKVFGSLYGYFLGLPTTYLVIFTGLIVTMYSAFGGIRSVTYTDLIQFVAFACLIPLIGIIIWDHTYGTDFSLVSAFHTPKFYYKNVLTLENPDLWSIIALFFYFAIPHMKPAWFQRVSMGNSISQVKKAFVISGCLILLITLALAWIPFLLYNLDSTLDPNNLLAYIIDNYTSPGVKGIMLVTVTAMAMSTADSYINASSVLFANDIYKPLKIGKNEVLASKLCAIALGGLSICFTFLEKDLLKTILLANSFYVPIVTPLLFITILGFRTTTKSVLIGMGAAFITTAIWKLAEIKANGLVFAMCVNAIFTIASHYLLRQPGGWKIKKKKTQTKHKKSILRQKMCRNTIIDFFCKHSPNNELTYMGLGIYLFIYTVTTMYSTQVELLKENSRIILTIYQTMMISGVMLAMYPIWPTRIKKDIIVQIAWPVVILVGLIFYSAFFVMLSDFNQLQFVIFTVNLILSIILLGWKLASIMIVVGFYCSVQFYKYYTGLEFIDHSIGSPQFVFMYSLVLIGTVLVIFLKPKQEYVEATEAKVDHLSAENANLTHKIDDYSDKVQLQEKEIARLGETAQRILNNVNHELRLPVGNVMNFAEMLSEGLGKYSEEHLKELSHEVVKNSSRLSSMILNMLDLATLDAQKIELNKRTVNLSEIVEDRAKRCFKLYKDGKKLQFKLDIEPEILIKIDPNYIRQTVDNLVINAINYSTEGTITVALRKKQNHVLFSIADEGLGIPKEEQYTIFEPFRQSSKTTSKAEGRGVGLALCKAAVEAHLGAINVESDGIKGAKFTFILPLAPR